MENSLARSSEFNNYHPAVNLVYFIFAIGITMFSNSPIFVLITFVFSWIYSIYLKGKKAIKFNLLCLIPIALFMVILNTFFVHNGETLMFYIGSYRVTFEAFFFGIVATLMFSAVIIWFSCFNVLLTSNKLIFLFGKITPVLGLTISMIFRFIPLLKNRMNEIRMGQKCIGRHSKNNGLINRIRQGGKEISILISWSLESSIETADSMEARGYGLKGRTSFHIYKFKKRDVFALIFMCLFGIVPFANAIIGNNSIDYYPTIGMTMPNTIDICVLIGYCFMLAMPIFIDIREEIKWKRLDSKI